MSPSDFLGEPWGDLCARLTGERRLGQWAQREPALLGLADLDALAQAVHSRCDLDYTDEVFAALLRLAAADNGDDQDAGLVVAHLMHNAARRSRSRCETSPRTSTRWWPLSCGCRSGPTGGSTAVAGTRWA